MRKQIQKYFDAPPRWCGFVIRANRAGGQRHLWDWDISGAETRRGRVSTGRTGRKHKRATGRVYTANN